jgi:hypothetical protein
VRLASTGARGVGAGAFTLFCISSVCLLRASRTRPALFFARTRPASFCAWEVRAQQTTPACFDCPLWLAAFPVKMTRDNKQHCLFPGDVNSRQRHCKDAFGTCPIHGMNRCAARRVPTVGR